MPFDPGLSQRLDEFLEGRKGFQKRKMFGGIGWLLNGNMCVGIYKEWLITRVGEAAAKKLFMERHVKPMDITGKPMKGWVMIASEGVEEDADLKRHAELAIQFVSKVTITAWASPAAYPCVSSRCRSWSHKVRLTSIQGSP